jgi:hypothetical protein
MNNEQILLETWHSLTPDKQQEVIDFLQFLKQKYPAKNELLNREKKERLKKVKKLQSIRDKIVASGEPLLTADEIEKEVLERRGGVQYD